MQFEPVVDQDSIRGVVVHVDTYSNLITNIPRQLFQEKVKGRKFTISLRSATIRHISDSYDDVPHGEVVALFASNGMLEIAMNKSTASSLLGIGNKFPVIASKNIEYNKWWLQLCIANYVTANNISFS